MEKRVFILSDVASDFPATVQQQLVLREFACYQATLAGLTLAETEDCISEGGIFLHPDADFDPYELAKTLHGLRRENITLTAGGGEPLGHVLTSPIAEYSPEELCALPKVTVRKSKRITRHNYTDILYQRQIAIKEKYAESGVFFESDEVTLSPLYTIGSGTFIGRGTTLLGSGSIGKNCFLTGACRLTDVTLGEGITVTSSVLQSCQISDGTTVGPFAYLRPGTVIGKNARIGDFVEIKNSVIDDGTKVSHLTYVGDSDVGKGVNFGCGTVTSNYDGLKKHRTHIGDHVFIGCNTNLVAPVSVGDNAYIAAGSTVTEDVPDGALAIARERQTNKEHWVKINKPELIR
ncbi:MAG: hypothetical protein IKY33_04405 [Clostridia bacterium]|nr:hypothetical protein [Clostridia bacterium]